MRPEYSYAKPNAPPPRLPLIVPFYENEPIPEAVMYNPAGAVQRPAFYWLHTDDGKIYVGSTGGIAHRLSVHAGLLKHGKHYCLELLLSFSRSFFITASVWYMPSREAALDAEQAYLDDHFGADYLLNKAPNARDALEGVECSVETRRKISAGNTGKIRSEWHKQRISEGNKGKTVSEETRRMISEGNKGKIRSAEMRLRLGRPKTPVIIDNVPYKSILDAARSLRLSSPSVWKRIRDTDPKYANYQYANP